MKGEWEMTMNHKVTGTTSSVPIGLLWGDVVSIVTTIISAAIASKLLDLEMMEWKITGYWIMATLILASFFGACVACHKIRRQRLVISVLSGVTYFATLLLITALLFGGQYEAVGVTSGLVLSGVGVAAMTGGRGGGRKKGRKRNYL